MEERGVKNENVAWFDSERISTGKISIVGTPCTFEYRDGIKLSIKPWEGRYLLQQECSSDVPSPPLTPRVLEVA